MSLEKLAPEQWVDRYADYLYNFTIVRVNDHIVAQDLVSETFLAGLKSKENFKGEATERTWLVAILKRKIIDHYRRSNSKKGRAEVNMSATHGKDGEPMDWFEERVEDEGQQNALDRIQNEELGQAIMSCLDSINEKQAAIFKMKTIEGMDTETICKEFDITASNLWVIIHRARKALAECLENNWLK